jgi:predicted nucleic acid-binding protein
VASTVCHQGDAEANWTNGRRKTCRGVSRGRILPVEAAVANAWGRLTASREASGRPLSMADAFIAATVEVHGLTLVTRNVSDFERTVRVIVNPWTDG